MVHGVLLAKVPVGDVDDLVQDVSSGHFAGCQRCAKPQALYRSWAIGCEGRQVYAPRHRPEWLNKIGEAGVRRRAEFFYQQLDALRELRQAVRKDLLAESRKQSATKLWTYSGLVIETRDSAQYRYVGGQMQRSKKPPQLRISSDKSPL